MADFDFDPVDNSWVSDLVGGLENSFADYHDGTIDGNADGLIGAHDGWRYDFDRSERSAPYKLGYEHGFRNGYVDMRTGDQHASNQGWSDSLHFESLDS